MEDGPLDEAGPKKGVVIKLFGVILIFLGVLDSMMSWRGGFPLSELYVLLIAGGIFLYALGAIRRASGTTASTAGQPRQRVRRC